MSSQLNGASSHQENNEARHLVDMPDRLSLSVRVAGAIRKSIDSGAWRDFLPSERRLSEIFQISRPTIRAAIHLLVKEKIIGLKRGHRSQITSLNRKSISAGNRTILIVTHELISLTSGSAAHCSIAEMRTHLNEHGFATEIFICKSRGGVSQCRKLEAIVNEKPVICCVLVSASRDLQQWFASHSIPALVLGTCHANVQLPSLDAAYRAVCRHATSFLLQNGHRNVAFLLAKSRGAGNLESERGFREEFAKLEAPDTGRGAVVYYDDTVKDVLLHLDALFNSASPPTALFIGNPKYVFIIMIHLMKRGLSVPEDVSLIVRDTGAFFTDVNPPITHYRVDVEAFAGRLTRIMLNMAGQRDVPRRPVHIFPEFIAGGTVRKLRPEERLKHGR